MIRQAVVLAGGLGTRLGPLTTATPKPLLPVGGRPFIEWLLWDLRRQGFTSILLLAGFHGNQFGPLALRWSELRIIVESAPLGTGGAIRHALAALDPVFLLLNGDSFFDINLLDLATSSGGRATLALRGVEDVSRYGAVVLEGSEITQFSTQPVGSGPGLINGGVGVLPRSVIEKLQPDKALSIEGEVYPKLAAASHLRGRVYNRPFIDIGVPTDFARGQHYMPQLRRRGGIVFVSPLQDSEERGLESIKNVAAAVKTVNDAGLFAFLADTPRLAGSSNNASDQQSPEYRFARINVALRDFGAQFDAIVGLPTTAGRSSHPSGRRSEMGCESLAGLGCDAVDWDRVIFIADGSVAAQLHYWGRSVENLAGGNLLAAAQAAADRVSAP